MEAKAADRPTAPETPRRAPELGAPGSGAAGAVDNAQRYDSAEEMELPYTALDAQFEAASKTVADARKHVQRTPPPLLYHYTDAQGLLGILESSRFRATNYRFLNDPSEVAHGMAVYQAIVQKRLSSNASPVISEFLQRTLNTANAFDGMLDCYVGCFCESEDLINQWRDYADSGRGFAIGFHAREIGRRKIEHPTQDVMIRRVEYDEKMQTSLIDQVIDLACNVLEPATKELSVQEASLVTARGCKFVRDHIADYLPCFKHRAFAFEAEWRVCHVPDLGKEGHVMFRQGRYGLTPYVPLDLSAMAGVNSNRLPIARIVHGPTRDPAHVQYALSKLLRAKGFAFVEIVQSTLPLRL